MPITTVAAPDGTEIPVNHPEGATQDEIIAYAQANYKPAESEPTPAPYTGDDSMFDQVNNRIQALGQGLSFGTTDEASSIISNIIADFDGTGNILNDSGVEDDRTWGDRLKQYWDTDDSVADMAEKRAAFAEENPGEAIMWEVAGGLLAPGLAGAKAVQAAGKGAGALKAGGIAAGVGAAEGGLYGAGVADGGDMAKSVMTHMAIGAGGGAVMGAAANKIGNALKAQSKIRKNKKALGSANKEADAIEDRLLEVAAEQPNASPDQRIKQVMQERNLTMDELDGVFTMSGRELTQPNPTQVQLAMETAEATRRGGPGQTPLQGEAAAGKKVIDDVLGAISTRIGNKSPKVKLELRKHDMLVATGKAAKREKAQGWGRLDKREYREVNRSVKKALMDDDFKKVDGIIAATNDPELQRGWEGVKEVSRQNKVDLGKVGYNIEKEGDHFSRVVRDPNRLRQRMGAPVETQIDTAKKRYAAKNKKSVDELTDRETAHIVNGVLSGQGIGGKGAGKLGTTKARTIAHVNEEMLDEYMDPVEAFEYTLSRITEDVEERRFFGDHAPGGGPSQIDVDESVGNFVGSLNLNPTETAEMIQELGARFGKGKESVGKWQRRIKNIGLATALGNPKSALIQMADVGHSMYANGFLNTLAVMGRKTGVDVDTIGLGHKIAAEFETMGKSTKALNMLLKGSGFKDIDKFGKNTFIKASLRKHQKELQLPSGDKKRVQFEEKMHELFGDETPDLLNAIKNGDGDNPNLKTLLWSDLADVQPIANSELPIWYLNNPNFRWVFTLKSFALKQADIIRRDVIQEAKKGNYEQAARKFGRYMFFTGGAAYATNEARNALFSMNADPIEYDPEFISNEMLAHMLAATGFVSKYNIESGQGSLKEIVKGGVVPPFGLIEGVGKDLYRVLFKDGGIESPQDSEIIKQLPYVGRTLNGLMSGFEDKAKEKKKEIRDRDGLAL